MADNFAFDHVDHVLGNVRRQVGETFQVTRNGEEPHQHFGVLRLGGTPHAAIFRGVAQGNAVVIIRVPNGGISLTRVGGTETILLNAFTLDGQSKRTLAQAGIFDFKVGATLRPTAGQADGLYTGTFDVTIQYP